MYPGFLSSLLFTTGVRRAVSVVVEPLRADVAARAIRRRKTEQIADQAQRARMGQAEDAGLTTELRDVLQQEASPRPRACWG